MDLSFDIGDPQRPKGHAVLYFRVDTEPDKVYATYVVTLPIKSDLGKYVPPFLATHLGGLPLNDLSAFAMPPLPEPVDSHAELERISQMRQDDLVYAGSMFSFDLPRMMESVTEAVQAYSDLWVKRFGDSEVSTVGVIEEAATPEPAAPDADDDQSFQVNEVLFGLMSESDKLAELARLLGSMRFAAEGGDAGTVDEMSREITTLARHLPETFQVSSLLAVAKDTSQKGSRLAQLYLDRCFRLSAGDYSAVQGLDDEIRALEA
ncbi:uncharacterized protein METZ01_LOCUS304272 [marine metagenome]|uniref:Uncharacterized protein n=1 Tax=marine metagenome TaxID=408172 RepID=A0A382MSN9_9ZZZZ